MGLAEFIASIINPENGVIALLGISVYFLTRDHAKNDSLKDARIEKLEGQVDVATAALKEQTQANAAGADAQEETARAVKVIAQELRRQKGARC